MRRGSSLLRIFNIPKLKIEAGIVWHSWDGDEWWSGEPSELTRSLTIQRVGSVAALEAFGRDRAHPRSGYLHIDILPEPSSSRVSWLGLRSEVLPESSLARRWLRARLSSFRALWSEHRF
jgi:hypothetical protein